MHCLSLANYGNKYNWRLLDITHRGAEKKCVCVPNFVGQHVLQPRVVNGNEEDHAAQMSYECYRLG